MNLVTFLILLHLNAAPVLAEPNKPALGSGLQPNTIEQRASVSEARESTDRSDRVVSRRDTVNQLSSRGGVHPYPGFSPADVFVSAVTEDEANKPWSEPTPIPTR